MIYRQSEPSPELSSIIKSFWLVDSEGNKTIDRQKIIPDGYPELIFHYGDPYRINISGEWQLQGKSIVAGQIRNFFHLENTGESKMFAIKFQPWALNALFQLEMSILTDNVIDVPSEMQKLMTSVQEIATSNLLFEEKVSQIEQWFLENGFQQGLELSSKEKAVAFIIENNGVVNLKDLQNRFQINERTLERYCKSSIGLSPKFYSRIIRFSHIFQLVQDDQIDWADIVYKAGYYDQSHFIKNFKEFTGEDPSKYGFSSQNMANFFLNR